MSDPFLADLGTAFNTRELLKVRVLDGAPVDAHAAAREITRRLAGVQVPQVIGRTIVLYRPFLDAPQISLTE